MPQICGPPETVFPKFKDNTIRYNQSIQKILPFTDAVLVQLYKMANSPNVVQTDMDVSSLLCW